MQCKYATSDTNDGSDFSYIIFANTGNSCIN